MRKMFWLYDQLTAQCLLPLPSLFLISHLFMAACTVSVHTHCTQQHGGWARMACCYVYLRTMIFNKHSLSLMTGSLAVACAHLRCLSSLLGMWRTFENVKTICHPVANATQNVVYSTAKNTQSGLLLSTPKHTCNYDNFALVIGEWFDENRLPPRNRNFHSFWLKLARWLLICIRCKQWIAILN